MSEWGNPAGKNTGHCTVNKIAVWGKTQGTEPSKYLKEKKSKLARTGSLRAEERALEIPLVAASEGGRA